MAITTLQGSMLPLEISTDSGTTWRKLVCLVTSPFRSTKSITREQSHCGPHTTPGEHTWGFDVTAILNTTPGSGSEISGEELLALHAADTKPLARMQYPASGVGAGGDLYISGNVWISAFGIENAATGLARFTATLEGDGPLDISA